MNPRTLLHNPQLQQLIDTIAPREQMPEYKPQPQMMGAWHELHRQAMITAAIANVHCAANEPGQTLCELRDGVLVMVVLLVCFLIFTHPKKS